MLVLSLIPSIARGDDTVEAGEADAEEPQRKLVDWSVLDRFGLDGQTQFFQFRLQTFL